MRVVISTFAAVLLHAAGLSGLVHATLQTEMPEPFKRRTICIFDVPTLHAGDLLLGGSEAETRAFFGDLGTSMPGVSPTGRKCIRYQYAGSQILTLLLEGGSVTRTWLAAGPFVPEACKGLPQEEAMLQARSAWLASYF